MSKLQVLRSSNTFNGLEMQNLIRVWGYYSITTLPKFPILLKFPKLLKDFKGIKGLNDFNRRYKIYRIYRILITLSSPINLSRSTVDGKKTSRSYTL